MNRSLVKTFGYVLIVPLLVFVGLFFITIFIVDFVGDVPSFALDKAEQVLRKMGAVE